VAVRGDRIALVGDTDHARGPQTRVKDATDRHLVPGLIDTHIHHCHSWFGATEFAEVMLRHGVTAFADGFYGPGIVGGPDAVRLMKDTFDPLPIRLLFLAPTLAYTQNRELGLTPAEGVSAADLLAMLDWDGCHGLEEQAPFPVLRGEAEVLDLLDETLARGKVIHGHAAGLTPAESQAYAAVGASTDHEMVACDEARDKARAGIRLLARQGDDGCTDVAEVVRARTELGIDPHAFSFCSDLASPGKLLDEGTVDHAVRLAISRGVLPVEAIQMATLSAAESLHAAHELGSIAPGRLADILVVDSLADLEVHAVLVGGEPVVRDGELTQPLPATAYPDWTRGTVTVAAPIDAQDLSIPTDRPDGEAVVRAIGVSDEGSLLTSPEHQLPVPVRGGRLEANLDADVLHLAIIDRLGRGTGIGLGFVHGFGLRTGALASTITAVSMNVVLAGTNPEDMAVAANRLIEMGGGKVVVDGGEVVAEVALPILGLHSERPVDEVVGGRDRLIAALRERGTELVDPIAQLEFSFACQDIGDIKLSEEGLVNVKPPRMLQVLVD
jgi:adenine deaminase